MNDYVNTLLEYVQDYLLSESLRIMSLDYSGNTIHFQEEPESKKIIEVNPDKKDEILNTLKKFIGIYLIELKEYLETNKILTPEDFESNKYEITKFIEILIKKHIEKIEKEINL